MDTRIWFLLKWIIGNLSRLKTNDDKNLSTRLSSRQSRMRTINENTQRVITRMRFEFWIRKNEWRLKCHSNIWGLNLEYAETNDRLMNKAICYLSSKSKEHSLIPFLLNFSVWHIWGIPVRFEKILTVNEIWRNYEVLQIWEKFLRKILRNFVELSR